MIKSSLATRNPSQRSRAVVITRALPITGITRSILLALCAIAASLALKTAAAATGLCVSGAGCTAEQEQASTVQKDQQLAKLSEALELADLGYTAHQRLELSDQEYFSFSGVGALVCTLNGTTRMATAFLVGAFDIGVTVAHPFEENGVWAQPENCVYTSTDSTGQVRERIPVTTLKAQWQAEDGAYGTTAKDFAVIRLSSQSHFAQRTMPLGRFSGNAASVLMIGFSSGDADTLKRKTQGTVYARAAGATALTSQAAGFAHDMDCKGIAAGAPVVDERSGVIIGVHTQVSAVDSASDNQPVARNTMITMNEWLEKVLRAEMETAATAANTAGR